MKRNIAKEITEAWKREIGFLDKDERMAPIDTICQIAFHYNLIDFRLQLLHVLRCVIPSPCLCYDNEEIADLVDFMLEIIKLFEAASVVNDMVRAEKFTYKYMDES